MLWNRTTSLADDNTRFERGSHYSRHSRLETIVPLVTRHTGTYVLLPRIIVWALQMRRGQIPAVICPLEKFLPQLFCG